MCFFCCAVQGATGVSDVRKKSPFSLLSLIPKTFTLATYWLLISSKIECSFLTGSLCGVGFAVPWCQRSFPPSFPFESFHFLLFQDVDFEDNVHWDPSSQAAAWAVTAVRRLALLFTYRMAVFVPLLTRSMLIIFSNTIDFQSQKVICSSFSFWNIDYKIFIRCINMDGVQSWFTLGWQYWYRCKFFASISYLSYFYEKILTWRM